MRKNSLKSKRFILGKNMVKFDGIFLDFVRKNVKTRKISGEKV